MCTHLLIESLQASQVVKIAGRSAVLASQLLIGNKTIMQSFDPHKDLDDFNIMDAEYFDNTVFKSKDEKNKFLEHYFDQIKLTTDSNNKIVSLLHYNDYSRYQCMKLMKFAQTVAHDDHSDIVKLKHFERAHVDIRGHIPIQLNQSFNDLNSIAHHEAGHAVMLVIMDTGSDLLFVSIQPYQRYCEKKIKNVINQGYASSAVKFNVSIDQYLDRIKMLFAGGISELELLDPNKSELHTLHDFLALPGIFNDLERANIIKDLLFSEHDTSSDNYKKIDDKIREQFNLTCIAVKESQPAIKIIAQELLQEKVISGKRVAEIVKLTMKQN